MRYSCTVPQDNNLIFTFFLLFLYALKYHFFSFKLYINFTLVLSFLFSVQVLPSLCLFNISFFNPCLNYLRMWVKREKTKARREWVCDKVKKDDNWIMIQKMNSVSRKYSFSLKRDINKFCEMCLMLPGWVFYICRYLKMRWRWNIFIQCRPSSFKFFFINWFLVENISMINVWKEKLRTRAVWIKMGWIYYLDYFLFPGFFEV